MATSLVWDFMVRDEHADGLHSVRTPVLLFTGVRGTGKTELLTDLQALLASNFPYASISGEWPFKSTRDMLALLAFDLNRAGAYGKLAFPRLLTGEIVIGADIDLDLVDRDHARQQVIQVLANHRKIKGVLENSISAILQGALTPVQAHLPGASGYNGLTNLLSKYGAEALLGGFAARRHGRAVLLGTGQEWWGHQDRGLEVDPIDELISLRMAADRVGAQRQARDGGSERRDANSDSKRMVTRQLWAAFLADLRDNFSNRRRAINWTSNCVLLLDNADTPVARAFLEELVNVRERERGEPDPFTVVATSRGDLAMRVSVAGLSTLADASRAHYRTRTGAATWWYPVLLPELSWADTSTMIDALQLPGVNGEAVTAAVHGFTCGHPGATSTLLTAMAAYPPATGVVNLPGLLAAKHPAPLEDRERTVQDALLDGLLAAPAEGDMVPKGDLATCAAARYKETALRLATDSGLLGQQRAEVKGIFAPELWLTEPTGGRAVLHPLLRRLLLWRLASREAKVEDSWARVHLWLRRHALRARQTDAALYYTLALAGTHSDELHELLKAQAPANPQEADPLKRETPLEHVARHLTRSLKGENIPQSDNAGKSDNAATWLRRVAAIAAAPTRLDLACKPRDQVVKLTQWVGQHEEPLAPVARYLAYCWLGADPLSAPSWSWLLDEMASELDRLAPYSNDEGLSVLRDEAERYRYLAGGGWQEIEHFWMNRTESADDTKPSQGLVDVD